MISGAVFFALKGLVTIFNGPLFVGFFQARPFFLFGDDANEPLLNDTANSLFLPLRARYGHSPLFASVAARSPNRTFETGIRNSRDAGRGGHFLFVQLNATSQCEFVSGIKLAVRQMRRGVTFFHHRSRCIERHHFHPKLSPQGSSLPLLHPFWSKLSR